MPIQLKNIPLIRALSSLKITLGCLILLFILTFWGTIDQVQHGLYHAQERFFHSFYFLLGGFLPLPGAQLVLWVLFVNLVCATINRFEYRISKLGIIIIHLGIILYCVSAFVTFHDVQESQLTLREKEGSNVSSAYRDWELSVWKEKANRRHVAAHDAKNFKPGQVLDFGEYGFQALVQAYYPNAEAYVHPHRFASPARPLSPDSVGGQSEAVGVNASGIHGIAPVELNPEPEKNIPGGIFVLKGPDPQEKAISLLLYGVEPQDYLLKRGGEVYHFKLRRKRYPLPLTVRLIDFIKEVHPNTDVARSYQSRVEIQSPGLSRDVVISMNRPLRYKNFTFYQASYAVDGSGREFSTLAVVKNSGRWLPYLAGLVTFVGLVTHFAIMGFQSRNPSENL